ncbi:hypothetical protein MKX08_003233 [Trichoderma sp. CBMAI-0020]|nr:hypothetical protein MKX08_003233 [Trichoderma sp. CBMAI-0020]
MATPSTNKKKCGTELPSTFVKSVGKRYASVIYWQYFTLVPPKVADMIVRLCTLLCSSDCEIIFSGLDLSVAGKIEMAFLQADFAIFSNAGNYRMAPLIPLMVPTVNLAHLQLVPAQREYYKLQKGFLVCNSNCAVASLVVAFAATCKNQVLLIKLLLPRFKQHPAPAIQGLRVILCQGLDIIDNVIPYIAREEDKIQAEARKILGNF